MILKDFDLIRFSSIFGSLYIKNYDNLIKCFNSNMNILFNKKNLIYTKNIKDAQEDNKIHGNRTMNTKLGDNHNYDSTFAHHDLSFIPHKEHFERGLKRLDFIKKNKDISILFVNISHKEFANNFRCLQLIESIKLCGFKNFKVLSIFKGEKNRNINLVGKHIVYEINSNWVYPQHEYTTEEDNKAIKEILLKHFTFDNLLTKEKIDNQLKSQSR